MSAPDNFLLSHRDHQTSLAGSIREETEFHDVTLACEDQQVGAHKVVLAAVSSKLRTILLSNPHPHPLIYLYGVKFSVLENMLKFIYTGEVIISSQLVNTFLDVAEELQVKGLGVLSGGAGGEVSTNTRSRENVMEPPGGAETGGEDSTTNRSAEIFTAASPTNSRNRKRSSVERKELTIKEQPVDQEFVEENEGQENNSNTAPVSFYYNDHLLRPTQEEEVLRPKVENMNTDNIAEDEEEYEDYEDGDDPYNDYVDGEDLAERGEKRRICPYCQKIFRSPSDLVVHIRTHTKEKPFGCEHCTKKFSQKQHLKKHIQTVHLGEKQHQCPHCNKTFSQSSNLKRHIKTQHLE